MPETKLVTEIRKSQEIKKRMLQGNRGKENLSRANKAISIFNTLYKDVEELWESEEILYFEDNNIVFYPRLLLLMEKTDQEKISFDKVSDNINGIKSPKMSKDNKWKMELLTESEARYVFLECRKEKRIFNYHQVLCFNDDRTAVGYFVKNGEFINIYSSRAKRIDIILSLRVPRGHHFNKGKYSKMEILLRIGVPEKLKDNSLYKNFRGLWEEKLLQPGINAIKLTDKGKNAAISGDSRILGKSDLRKKEDSINGEAGQKTKLDIAGLPQNEREDLLKYYTHCDFIRANISPYDIAWLEDPNRGHWELWDGNRGEDLIKLKPGFKMYGRNPESDIKNDSIVGIDFGTKSTVVVCQNESGIIQPMPVGNGDVRRELTQADFENPTVMQFIDFPKFIESYNKNEGRPYTRWQDLIISHAAEESMKDTGVRSAEFYSYLYDLKQWAGEGKGSINLRDKSGNDILLAPFEEKEEQGMNPIEIYAYYIGLYINNMNNGIYLDYLLSFPVTYDKKVRNEILKSFEKGLKKSLPQSILDNEDMMSRFHVNAGSSEPAAYAICALEEYGFNPQGEEKVFYGIFDFGGGTSDFDFGLWTQAEDADLFDYKIEHFGTQGDRYLGGENLLQLLAFYVFAENIGLCRKENICFAKPNEMTSVPTELMGFVNDSQEARMNQKLMMEKLRPFWEREDSEEEVFCANDYSDFQISLFDTAGLLKSNLTFSSDPSKMEEILKNRIEKGVKQFFEALKDTFSTRLIKKTSDTEGINIFLAGNSSKSPLLRDIFDNNIVIWNENINTAGGEDGSRGEHFTLFPPLGTSEADAIRKERGIARNDKYASPTGKTGVAWGLIEGREGGRIEVVEEVAFENDSKFSYFLGIQRGRTFFPKVRRDAEYGKWIRFLPAKRKINEVLYTSLPEAASGKLSYNEEGVLRRRIEIPYVEDSSYIYLKLESSNGFSYAIGDGKGEIDDKTITRVVL